LQYTLPRHLQFTLGFGFERRRSTSPIFNYNDRSVSIGVQANLRK
jgi:hypothetical protein